MARKPKGEAVLVRDRMIATAGDLIEAQGYHGTGLAQIVQESGAPRGSLYYYFPDGKEGLTAAAVERTGLLVSNRIQTLLAEQSDMGQAIQRFIYGVAENVERSGFRAGGPLTTVAMETAVKGKRLNEVCRQAYGRIQEAFALSLRKAGYSRKRAAELATFVTMTIEGGIILSRTFHTGDPLRRAADEVRILLERA